MILRVRYGKEDEKAGRWRSGNRPLSLIYSVTLHAAWVSYAFLAPQWRPSEKPNVYRETVVALEKDHKLIYYDFRKELPEVSAANASKKLVAPTPNQWKSKQRIVTAPDQKDGKQFVFLPEPKIRLQEELKAPNLIAVAPAVAAPPRRFTPPEQNQPALKPAAALPNAPQIESVTPEKQSAELAALLHKPIAGPQPRQFTPPKETPKLVAPVAALPNAPAIAGNAGDKSAAELSALLQKTIAGPPPRQFTPPKETPKLAVPVAALPNAPAVTGNAGDKPAGELAALLHKPIAGPPPRQFTPPTETPKRSPAPVAALPNAPTVAGVGNGRESAEVSALLNKPLAGPPPKQFTPPPGRAAAGASRTAVALPSAPALASNGPAATATVAIIGMNPADVPHIPAPEGSRPARIVAGTPVPGATRPELGGGKGTISAPNLSVQGAPADSPATATRVPFEPHAAQPPIGLARVQLPQVLPVTPHVSVPQWPNTRTLPAAVERHFQNRVVYITLIPSQTGQDWIVWFGEITPTPFDEHLLMRPPTLVHSGSIPPFPSHKDRGTGSIRVVATIHKDGEVDATSELSGGSLDRELVAALHTWQFSPAMRNGVAIDADAVIEIPLVFGTLSLR